MKAKAKNRGHLKLAKIGLAVALLFGLLSCDGNKIFEENQGFENNTWLSEDVKTFSFNVTDTISPINLFVNLRTTTDYAYSNIYVFLYSEFPNGTSDKDTLEFLLAQSDGKWLGDNTGTVVEFRGQIAAGGRFSVAGDYTFKLQHAMREESLPEIIDIGFRAEKMEL